MDGQIIEQLNTAKGFFETGMNAQGVAFKDNDERSFTAVNIAQREFLFNYSSPRGITYLNTALNWPPTNEKTLSHAYPQMSDRPKMAAMATYELLASVRSGGFFTPTEETLQVSLDAARVAKRLEEQEHLSVEDIKDVLYARFANAIVGAAGFASPERTNTAVTDLQKSVDSVRERFPQGAGEISERQGIDRLVEFFNQADWSIAGTYEGQQMKLVASLFRAYQGLPMAEKP